MPIERIGKFLEADDLGIVHSIGMESTMLDECIAEVERRHVQGVFGCPAFDFRERNLDFLEQLNGIRQVWFWEIHLDDVSGLYSQQHLEYLGIFPKRPALDFSVFTGLREMVWQPVRNDTGVSKLKHLERLDLWRYKARDLSLADLEVPESLRELELNWCNLESLDALQSLPRVEELQLHYCRNLKSLSGLRGALPNLKKLVVTRCANLEGVQEALDMDLEHLYINVRGRELANRTARESGNARGTHV